MAYTDFNEEIKGMFKDPSEEQNVVQKAFKAKQREHNEQQRLKKIQTTAEKPVDASE
jgi:hypothetical protein